MARIGEWVTRCTRALDPHIQSEIMGSYRRGAETSGDVDMIFYSEKEDIPNDFLATLAASLKQSGFLLDTLVGGTCKYQCLVRLPQGLCRQLDLWIVKYEELGAALLHFTGNDIFNRSIRLLASKKGMSLNEHGLFKNVIRKNREKLNKGIRIAGETEQGIFDALGIPYRPPTERTVF